MADSNAIIPYHQQPFDVLQTIENILMSDESPAHNLQNSDDSYSLREMADPDDPFIDPFIWENFFNNDHMVDNLQADPSSIDDETNVQEGQNFNLEKPNLGNPIKLSIWPIPPEPYTCTCCQVLREIIHTNGVETTKLEIHGRLGMIFHGILEKGSVDKNTQNTEYQMFDFCKESIYSVKQFLVQYCEERKQVGYTMLQDPLSTFYEALCVGMDWDFNFDFDGLLQGSPIDLGENQPEITMNQPEVVTHLHPQNNAEKSTKRSLAKQRERTRNLTLKDLIAYFHLPVDNAAEELQVCTTVIKKICRREGLSRWPYRKIKCIEKQIERRSKSLAAADAEERARAQADIERLNQQLTNFFSQFSDR